MGLLTLADFRNRLSRKLSDPGIGNEELDSFINQAYIEVVHQIDPNMMVQQQSASFDADGRTYSVPTGCVAILSVIDKTNERKLIYKDKVNMHSTERDERGPPRYWSRQGNTIKVWPTDEDVNEIGVLFTKELTVLSAASDVTALSYMWDFAIEAMSSFMAFASLGRLDTAEWWKSQAERSIKTRMNESFLESMGLTESVWVPSSAEEVTNFQEFYGDDDS